MRTSKRLTAQGSRQVRVRSIQIFILAQRKLPPERRRPGRRRRSPVRRSSGSRCRRRRVRAARRAARRCATCARHVRRCAARPRAASVARATRCGAPDARSTAGDVARGNLDECVIRRARPRPGSDAPPRKARSRTIPGRARSSHFDETHVHAVMRSAAVLAGDDEAAAGERMTDARPRPGEGDADGRDVRHLRAERRPAIASVRGEQTRRQRAPAPQG